MSKILYRLLYATLVVPAFLICLFLTIALIPIWVVLWIITGDNYMFMPLALFNDANEYVSNKSQTNT
jgi:hypothetical protein